MKVHIQLIYSCHSHSLFVLFYQTPYGTTATEDNVMRRPPTTLIVFFLVASTLNDVRRGKGPFVGTASFNCSVA